MAASDVAAAVELRRINGEREKEEKGEKEERTERKEVKKEDKEVKKEEVSWRLWSEDTELVVGRWTTGRCTRRWPGSTTP